MRFILQADIDRGAIERAARHAYGMLFLTAPGDGIAMVTPSYLLTEETLGAYTLFRIEYTLFRIEGNGLLPIERSYRIISYDVVLNHGGGTRFSVNHILKLKFLDDHTVLTMEGVTRVHYQP